MLSRPTNCPRPFLTYNFPLLPLVVTQALPPIPVNTLPILRFGLLATSMCLSELIGSTAALICSHKTVNINVKILISL